MVSPEYKNVFPLIQTKLYRPPVNADVIKRPHLLARLHQGLRHKLILVSAPPGFGKTTLASQWLDSVDQPYTWLSLDDRDNHLLHFLSYLSAAIRRCVPEACATLQDILATANLPDFDYLADLLLEELNALPTELILVLDDYHCLRSSDVHQLLRHLLRYCPPRLHLVILTRTDPPLALGRLRLGRQITEIRAADLRFGLAETRHFFREHTSQPLDDALLHSLQTRTEGWAIGLQLARIALQSHSPEQFLARFGGSHRLLAGYLVEEVMADLPQVVIEFLTRTALLDRFCAPLADALLADTPWSNSSQGTIAQLEAENLFIIPLDDEGTWFRYHDMFRDFLLHRLKQEKGADGLVSLHQRAGEWLAQASLVDEALRHMLAADDESRAAELVESNVYPLLNQQVPAPVLDRWLVLFSEAAIQTHPGLLIAQICLFVFRWDMAAMATAVSQARLLIPEEAGADNVQQRRLATLDTQQGYLLYWHGDFQRAMTLLQRALDIWQDPIADLFMQAQAILFLAFATANCGQQDAALARLRTALAEARSHDRPTVLIYLIGCTAVHLYAAEFAALSRTATEVVTLANVWQARPGWSAASTVQVWRGWAYYFLGMVAYEQNDLETAAQQWQQVERYRVNPGTFHNSQVGLALVAQAQGEGIAALAHAQTAREFAVEQRSPGLLRFSEALEERLALLGDQAPEVLRRLEGVHTAVFQSQAFWLEPIPLTALRCLIHEATPASLAKAVADADACLQLAQKAHDTRRVIQVSAMQALIWHTLRQTAKAFAALARALTLGEPSGFTRTFLDLGAPMADLLRQFDSQHEPWPYVKRLLAAFAREVALSNRGGQTAAYVQHYGITPLTPRELELLTLVAQRLTVKEMAERLVISPNTVKRHVSSIYSKLRVKNRRQAIAKAKEAGLLPSP